MAKVDKPTWVSPDSDPSKSRNDEGVRKFYGDLRLNKVGGKDAVSNETEGKYFSVRTFFPGADENGMRRLSKAYRRIA
jgi:hypothetical protein